MNVGYSVKIPLDFSQIRITAPDNFVSLRDNLVELGKLNPPYTDEKEYKQLIYNGIKYWDGKQFQFFHTKNPFPQNNF